MFQSSTGVPQKPNYQNTFILLVTALLVCNAGLFAFSFAIDAPRADAFRHISLYLMPYYSGDLSLDQLWSNHHPKPLHALFYIFNAKFFDLNYRLETYAGLLSLLLILFFIYKKFIFQERYLQNSCTHLSLIALLTVFLVLTSLSNTIHHIWTLVTFSLFSIFLGIYCYYRFSLTSSHHEQAVWPLYITSLLLLLANFDRAIVLLAPILLISLFCLISNRNRKRYLNIILVLIAQIIAIKIFISLFTDSSKADKTPLLHVIIDTLRNPLQYLKFVSSGLSSSFLPISRIAGIKSSYPFAYQALSILVSLVYGTAIILGLSKRNLKVSIMPLAMALMPLFFITAVYISRFHLVATIDNLSASPRYAMNYHIGWAGIIWLYFLNTSLTHKAFYRNFFLLISGILCTLHLLHNSIAWNFSQAHNDRAINATINILNAGNNLYQHLLTKQCPQKKVRCKRVVDFLKSNQLSSFRASKLDLTSLGCSRTITEIYSKGNWAYIIFSEEINSVPFAIKINNKMQKYLNYENSLIKIRSQHIKKSTENNLEVLCFKDGKLTPLLKTILTQKTAQASSLHAHN